MAAARAMLDEIHGDLPNPSKDLNGYIFGAMGNHYVVMACLPSGIYGTTPAALVVSQMQSSFPSIRFYMMVGIGGGIPTKADIRLGDVVVSVPTGQCPGVVQHDRGKIVAGGHTEQTGNLHGPPRGLLNVVSKLRAIHSSDGNRIRQILEEAESKLSKKIGFIRPEDDILFRAEYDHIDSGSDTCDYCNEQEALIRPSRDTHDPVVHYGIIASGNTVIKDGKSRDLIGEKNGAYCFEMEAAGKKLPSHSIAAYFFSTRGQGLEKSRHGMLRSLLYQLCDNDSGAYRAFLPRFRDKEKKHGHSWEWREDELETILLEFIASSTKPVVLLVDALDECDESEVRMAVNFLETLSSVSVTAKRTLNVCLSSRHYPTISMAKKLDLTIEGIAGHNKDISIYVEAKLRIDDDDIKYELCNKAEGLFMWVILVVGFLNRAYDDGDIDAVWIRLRELPPDLDAVFSTLLEIDNPEKHRTVSMLEFMLFCKGSLAPIELYYAVKAGTKPESLRRHGTLAGLTDKIIKNFIINHSRGLIEVCKTRYHSSDNDSRVQFIHKTVEDFLLRNNRLQTLHSRMGPYLGGFGHEGIALSCLEYLRMTDFGKEPSLESIPDVVVYLNRNYPFLKYAAGNIFYHAEKTDSGHQKIIIQLINTPDLVPELISVCEIFGRIFPEGSRYPCGQDASLLYAVSVQNCPKLLKAALALPPSYEVNVDALGGYFGTPLQAAISIWANDIIQILLDAGADLNVTGGKYFHVLQTAIHCTPMGIQDEAFTLSLLAKLIGAGADVNANGGEFGTALQAAAVTAPSNRKYTSRYIGYDTVTKMIEMLLDAGADVNVQGGTYGNVLQAAVANALLAYNDDREPAKKVVMMLIEAGADVNAQGGFYGNALQAAARLVGLPGNGDYIGYEVSKMLLDAGSNVNAQGGPYGSADVNAQIGSQKYSTPLALACGWGWMASDLIENLLNEGADVNARSRDGSAVDAAFIRGCFDVQSRRFNKVSRVEGSLSILRRLQLAGAAGAVEAEQKLTKYRDWVSIQVSQGRKRSELPYDLYLQETSRSMLA
ncbi:hypothetical protein TWF788_001181 [Orbilia oligospora]|uniref:Nephrocystin 3-like N-terminal domain-containing protein n=1 Tax=Orbilia oligospora TaxID=2813651 RepID=A0A7C8KEG3_ORBOL|nr:hypothetical protein TWF788_001181 [Orbilia oligospora]